MLGKTILYLELIILTLQLSDTANAECCCKRKNISNAVSEGIARYDNYRIYYVDLANIEQVEIFQQLEAQSDSCTFYGHARHPNQKLTILVAAHKLADFENLLKAYNVQHKILSYNFQEKIDRSMKEVMPKGTDVRNFDWLHYFHLDSIYEWMEMLARQHPKNLTLLDMGSSHEGLPIKGLKIIRNSNNTAIFIESGIHAREWIAPATATYIINELINSSDIEVQRLVNNYNWIIFPVVNPDGYKFSFEYDRMWRKNRRLFGICHGVDLNRNYPNHWNTTGSSGDPCRYDYSGPEAASEVETQRLIHFIRENIQKENIKTYLSLHSYSQLLMFPYGYTPERVVNYDDLLAIGKKAVEKMETIDGRIYKSGSIFETIYPSSGGSKDWAHGVMNIPITFTFELRGPPDSNDLFILPAEEIIPTAKETFAAIVTIVNESEALGYYK